MHQPSPHFPILIVDDDQSIRDVLADSLRDEGYNVATAANGRDALDQIGHRDFAAIVTDLSMPVMDGRALGAALGHADDHPPLILMTAVQNGRAIARELGAAACLIKPFAIDSLLTVLASVGATATGPVDRSVLDPPIVVKLA